MQCRKVSYRGREFYVPVDKGDETSPDRVAMQHWFDSSLRSTLTYAEQVWHVNKYIEGDLLSVLEVFCGFGMSTATLEPERISNHVALDYDEACCDAFQQLRPDADVFCTDSYFAMHFVSRLQQFDCVYLEYNSMTTYRLLQDTKERELFENVLRGKPRYVVLVDSAKVKEHLHYQTYSKFYEWRIESSEDYVRAVDWMFREEFGYGIAACAHDNINYTFLLDSQREGMMTCDIVDTRKIVDVSKFKDLGYVDL